MYKTLMYGLLSLFSCGALGEADSIFYNGKVYTVNQEQPWAEAFAVKDGVILDVGALSDIKKHQGEMTLMVDLHSQMVMPGIIDDHIRPDMGADNYLNIFASPFSTKSQFRGSER